jgi:hypothetical protein
MQKENTLPGEEEMGTDLNEAAQVQVLNSTESMDIETVEILIEDRIATGG